MPASSMGLGIYFPYERLCFQAPVPTECPKEGIFFAEALAACSAIHLARELGGPKRLLIYTNTFDIFNSLAVGPAYNAILMSTVDVMIEAGMDLRMAWIPTEHNIVADALSAMALELLEVLSGKA